MQNVKQSLKNIIYKVGTYPPKIATNLIQNMHLNIKQKSDYIQQILIKTSGEIKFALLFCLDFIERHDYFRLAASFPV